MRSSRVRRAAAVLLALAAGCSGLPPPMVGSRPPAASDARAEADYKGLVEHYSVEKQIFNGFDTVLFSGVTYEPTVFREARIRRKDAFQAQSASQLAKDLQAAQLESQDVYEFTVGVYMQNPRFDDLDFPVSIWRLALITPAGEVGPLAVRRVGKADINTRAYYPYMGDFWTVYRVRFPKVVDAQPLVTPGLETFTVILASSLGRAQFVLPIQ